MAGRSVARRKGDRRSPVERVWRAEKCAKTYLRKKRCVKAALSASRAAFEVCRRATQKHLSFRDVWLERQRRILNTPDQQSPQGRKRYPTNSSKSS